MIIEMKLTGKPDHIQSFVSDVIEVFDGVVEHSGDNKLRLSTADWMQVSKVNNLMWAHRIIVGYE